MDFLDTCLHLIYRDRPGYGWPAGIPALATGDFTLADYVALTAGAGVGGAIFLETGVDDADYRAEARFVAGLVGQDDVLGQIASCRTSARIGCCGAVTGRSSIRASVCPAGCRSPVPSCKTSHPPSKAGSPRAMPAASTGSDPPPGRLARSAPRPSSAR